LKKFREVRHYDTGKSHNRNVLPVDSEGRNPQDPFPQVMKLPPGYVSKLADQQKKECKPVRGGEPR